MPASLPLLESVLTSIAFAAVLAAALAYAWRTWRQQYLGYWAGFWGLYVGIWSVYVFAYGPSPDHRVARAVTLGAATLGSYVARALLAVGIASYLGWRAPTRRTWWVLGVALGALTVLGGVARWLADDGVLPRLAALAFRPYFLGGALDVALAIVLLLHRGGSARPGRWLLALGLLVAGGSDVWDVYLELREGTGWLAAPDLVLRLSALVAHVCDALIATGMMIAAIGTEHVRAETASAALRGREQQLQHAQRLETVGQLAGGVAHDFNNLLTAIVGSLSFIREALPPGSGAEEDVDAAAAAAKRASNLTRQLLTFARRQTVEPRLVDVGASVRELEPLLRSLLGGRARLDLRLAGAPAGTFIDPTQLEQLLLNLVVNARDAMPAGGAVAVETAVVALDAAPRSPERRHVPAGTWARLAVEDSGEGMDEATRAHIFEPFFTTKPPGRGSGLGLAVVHGIVTQAQGHLALRTAPGEGTRFEVYLPFRDGIPAARLVTPEAPGRGRETVLLVDDDPLVRAASVRALAARGYDVVAAGSGEEALAVAAARLHEVAVLVTDVAMPGLDGLALASELRRRRPDLPVLLVSGYATGLHEATLPGGLSARRLAKPYAPDELAARVRELLDGAG